MWICLIHMYMVFFFSEPMPSAQSLPPLRQTWMTTSPLTAHLRPPPPRLNTPRTTASSLSIQPPPLRLPSTTPLHHVVPHSPQTAAFTTSLAATPKTRCSSRNQPHRPRRPQTVGMVPSFTSLTRHRANTRWRRRCETFPSVTIFHPHLERTVPTRCLALCRHQLEWEAQREAGTWSPLPDHPSLRSARPLDLHPPLLSAHLRTAIVCLAQSQRQTVTTVCPLVLGIKPYAATLLELWTVHASAKVRIQRCFLFLLWTTCF